MSIDELRDTEGVSLVYDLAALIRSQTLRVDTRAFDTGALNQSTADNQVIDGLPSMARVIGIDVTTDNTSRLSRMAIYGDDIGVVTSAPLRSMLLWAWIAGGRSINIAAPYQAGDAALAAHLLAEVSDNSLLANYVPWVGQDLTPNRTGFENVVISTLTTAFGAGTVRVTGHLTLLFPTGTGGRFSDLLPDL